MQATPGTCIICYLTQLPIIAMLLGAGIWFYQIGHPEPAAWSTGIAIVVALFWSCRRECGGKDDDEPARTSHPEEE